jgi:hypothetical protein
VKFANVAKAETLLGTNASYEAESILQARASTGVVNIFHGDLEVYIRKLKSCIGQENSSKRVEPEGDDDTLVTNWATVLYSNRMSGERSK